MDIKKHSTDLDDLHKRLIQMQYIGVSVQYHSGHRWLYMTPEEDSGEYPSLDAVLKEKGITFNNKIYGSLFDTLNFVDYLLEKAGCDSLLDQYNKSDEGDDSWRWGLCLHSDGYYSDEKVFESRCDIQKSS